MTWECYTNTKPIARKEYDCDAIRCLHRSCGPGDLEGEEVEQYAKAKSEGFKILKGASYVKTTGFYDGEPSVFRARPEIDAMCRKYSLYDD